MSTFPFAEQQARRTSAQTAGDEQQRGGESRGQGGQRGSFSVPGVLLSVAAPAPRSTFCCDRVFSVIDPNYRSQTTRAGCVTHVRQAAAQCLETQLPKYM